MKCLNILGILWSGRGQSSKAVVYLLAAKNYYLCHHQSQAAAAQQGNAQIEDTYTHTLFYLAQAYGHLQDSSQPVTFYLIECLKRDQYICQIAYRLCEELHTLFLKC
eukprot:scaffold1882_cov163-Ochromonas_danica.AAC.14